MRAVVIHEIGAQPRLERVPDPACPRDGVVLAVEATGVCRSDWHVWRGHDPVSLPHVPGHELAGTVQQVGPEVTRWAPGDRVTAPFVCGCGRCETCRAGDAQVCPHQSQPGVSHWGSFAERVALHAADTNLVSLPTGLPAVVAASLGCRFATAYRALTAHARLAHDQSLVVHGCGGLGLSAVMIGIHLGAQVLAVDVNPLALARAQELGATTVDGSDGTDPAAAIRELTGGGAEVSVDAAGTPETAVASVRSLRRRGRHIQAGLLLAEESTPPVPMDLVIARELEIYGTHGMAARDYPPMLDAVAAGRLRPGELVGDVIALEEAPAALTGMDRPATHAGLTVVDLTR